MNSLNSVLLEGDVVQGPYIDQSGRVTFKIESRRVYKDEAGEIRDDTLVTEVQSTGRLATACHANLKTGRGVRVVGRLDQELRPSGSKALYVFAEHVEFKPVKANAPETDSLEEAAVRG
jgi:single-strand DNA-binding protein